ncbi:MAG: peptide chain release factor N(5)-glutamine methyltransferase [Gemmatimonadota bacterium]|nr:peptide chain release factor N(5)-glutamine methyltransferase [Gemmatimonadota bacterium]
MKTGIGSLPKTNGVGQASKPWTVLRVMLQSADYLADKGVESARLDAEHLLAHVLGIGRLEMYLQHERQMQPSELDDFRPLLKRRASREPLQYILGRQAFRDLEVEVAPGVLIPRAETEQLVGAVLEWAEINGRDSLVGLDLGTGSGAIALSLLTEGPFHRMVSTDTSEEALNLARKNSTNLGLDDRLELRLGSLFAPVLTGECFDVVISNPPYVPDGDRDDLPPEVLDWEPHEALFAGSGGVSMLRKVAAGAAAVMEQGGLLALEVGAGQAGEVASFMDSQDKLEDVRVLRDLAGIERIVTAVCSNERDEQG